MHTLQVSTKSRDQLVDITDRIRGIVRDQGFSDGALVVYVPHTTAGIAINEGADPSVAQDLQSDLQRLVPWDQEYYRHREGNSSSHTRSALTGSSELIIVEDGDLVLGTWQSVFFCEFDGPRSRRVHLKFLAA